MKMKKRKILKVFLGVFCVIIAVTAGIALYFANYYNLLPQKVYTAEDFGIETVYSETDFNKNGRDDYTDILLGARKDAENHPTYDGTYQAGGYPPDNIGVCTDVVWRAFREAGYSLREMVDRDVALRPDDYFAVEKRDKNIDFRRVKNLRVFFDKYAVELTCDINEISQWQPGDIVIFSDNKHIGIVSDKRNADGQCYIIHNGGQPNREEDYLKRGVVTGHYRFDASKVDEGVLVEWGYGENEN